MADIEVVVIDGLDDAIVGSTVISGREVIAYDFDKCVAIIMSKGHSEDYAQKWIEEISSHEFEGAPAFIYFDEETEFYGSSIPSGSTVH